MTLEEAKKRREEVAALAAGKKYSQAHHLAESGARDILQTLAYDSPVDAHLLAGVGMRLLDIAHGRSPP
jgi:RNA 3'-terminal phosphate cyclase